MLYKPFYLEKSIILFYFLKINLKLYENKELSKIIVELAFKRIKLYETIFKVT